MQQPKSNLNNFSRTLKWNKFVIFFTVKKTLIDMIDWEMLLSHYRIPVKIMEEINVLYEGLMEEKRLNKG